MKTVAAILFVLMSSSAFAQDNIMTPLTLIKSRMDSYNRHDLDSFLKNYSEDIQVFTYPNIPLGKKGQESLAKYL